MKMSKYSLSLPWPTRLWNRPPVSVVVTCHNYSKYLEESFLSALKQTRKPREIIIVDDASTDSTPQVARGLIQDHGNGPVVTRYLRSEVRLRTAQARNRGIDLARSEYVMVLDADDRLDPRYVECVAKLLDEEPKAAIAYSSYQEFGDRNRTVILPPFDPVVLLTDCIIMGCGMMRKQVWEVVGGYDPNQVFEDWELWVRIVSQGWKARLCEQPLYNYRVHIDSKDVEANKDRFEGERRIYEKHMGFYKSAGVTRLETGEWLNARRVPPFR